MTVVIEGAAGRSGFVTLCGGGAYSVAFVLEQFPIIKYNDSWVHFEVLRYGKYLCF